MNVKTFHIHIPSVAVRVQFLVETTIFGVLFWAPLLLDAMLSGNFSGTNPKAATPAHQTNAELVRSAAREQEIQLIDGLSYRPEALCQVPWSFSECAALPCHSPVHSAS